MNSADILNYVDMQPSTVREVFSTVTTSKSKSTRKGAAAAALAMAKKINPHVSLSPAEYIRKESVDNFMAFATEQSENEKAGWRYKLLVEPFKPLLLKMTCFLWELNYEQVAKLEKGKDAQYYEVGDGIVLAGLFLALTEGEG